MRYCSLQQLINLWICKELLTHNIRRLCNNCEQVICRTSYYCQSGWFRQAYGSNLDTLYYWGLLRASRFNAQKSLSGWAEHFQHVLKMILHRSYSGGTHGVIILNHKSSCMHFCSWARFIHRKYIFWGEHFLLRWSLSVLSAYPLYLLDSWPMRFRLDFWEKD